MKVEVFNYTWTPDDGETEVSVVSQFKVTMKFYERQKLDGAGSNYEIIEGSRDLVDSDLVIDGRYHPEFRIR